MPSHRADWPIPLDPIVLRGEIVRLEPLLPDHEPELVEISRDQRIWRYLSSDGGSPQAMRAYLEQAFRDCRSGSAAPFVIRTTLQERVVGMTRLKELSREHRTGTVGSWIAPAAWGTGANTEAKLLILEHAFERLGCIRIEFRTDSRNARSRAALQKLGAVEEGTLRSCVETRDGNRRDSVVFSVLDGEWATVKRNLRARLDRQLSRNASPRR